MVNDAFLYAALQPNRCYMRSTSQQGNVMSIVGWMIAGIYGVSGIACAAAGLGALISARFRAELV